MAGYGAALLASKSAKEKRDMEKAYSEEQEAASMGGLIGGYGASLLGSWLGGGDAGAMTDWMDSGLGQGILGAAGSYIGGTLASDPSRMTEGDNLFYKDTRQDLKDNLQSGIETTALSTGTGFATQGGAMERLAGVFDKGGPNKASGWDELWMSPEEYKQQNPSQLEQMIANMGQGGDK
jgi:hypothetical protein